jgi:integrase
VVRQAKNLQREKVERGYLEINEIEKLVNTPITNTEIKKAFLFSCFTGLRQSDIRNLQWKDISDNTITISQQKTKTALIIPLGKAALNILRSDKILHLPDVKVFNLPKDRSTINRHLSRWFERAKINKKAFYHLSRHTFATLNLTSGNEIYTVSKLLGHKSLKTTEIYANIIDEKKKEAVDRLPDINVTL